MPDKRGNTFCYATYTQKLESPSVNRCSEKRRRKYVVVTSHRLPPCHPVREGPHLPSVVAQVTSWFVRVLTSSEPRQLEQEIFAGFLRTGQCKCHNPLGYRDQLLKRNHEQSVITFDKVLPKLALMISVIKSLPTMKRLPTAL